MEEGAGGEGEEGGIVGVGHGWILVPNNKTEEPGSIVSLFPIGLDSRRWLLVLDVSGLLEVRSIGDQRKVDQPLLFELLFHSGLTIIIKNAM